MRNRETIKPTTSWWVLLLLILGGGVFAWYITYVGRGVDLAYEDIQKIDEQTMAKSVQKIDLGSDKPIYVPELQLYSPNHQWMYVTKTSPLPEKYEPSNLKTISLPTGDRGTTLRLRGDVLGHLQALFAKASQDDYDLMVSSAYRSISDQQTLFESTERTKGEAYAKKYVLTPGASEHHTGYAVDVTDASKDCQADSDDCLLSPASASWIATHAPDFGFIVRYPQGKESTTGISYEPWHLRYVGVVLARQLTDNDLTLDEFMEQAAPGRVR
jgi:D-alanyl-D-alanine carboxypeptidase